MKSEIARWIEAAGNQRVSNPYEARLAKSFASVLTLVNRANWRGACHATSAVLTVVLRAQEIDAVPFIGECLVNGAYFDHSWAEVDSRIYDVAISNPLIAEFGSTPVFAGLFIGTTHVTQVQYGVTSGTRLDPAAVAIPEMPFAEYLSNFSKHPKGLWGVAEDVMKDLGLQTDAATLKTKQSEIAWLTCG